MARDIILKRFYNSKEWINFRLMLINQRGPVCQKCGKIIIKSINIIGHHKVELTPENVLDYSISLNPELVELICFDCHNKEHNRFGYHEKNVYIVYGPPLAGKKTFVKQNMKRGDIVIDMDMLYQSISMLSNYDKPDNLYTNVRVVYNTLLDNVKTRFGKWNNAYIIGGYADKYKREKVVNELGAEIIFCNATKEECFNRLRIDEERKKRIDEWEGYIEKWFEEYWE